MLFIYVLKMFANMHFLGRTIFKIAEKRCWCCVRDTEFVPEFEVPSDVEIKGNKITHNSTTEMNVIDSNIRTISTVNNEKYLKCNK